MAPSRTTVADSSVSKRREVDNAASEPPTLEDEAIERKYRDFFWTYTEEPHRTRRLAIIKAHPEVRSRN
jgi:sphingolipid delta-4 desaturase